MSGKTRKLIKKTAVAIAGAILITIGIILLVLPGPGLAFIALGLFVLSTEFAWAERHYKRLEVQALKLLDRVKKKF